MTSPSDRSEPTLPNLVSKNASIEDVRSRLADIDDVDEVDFKGWTGLHWALVRELSVVIACPMAAARSVRIAADMEWPTFA